MSRIFSSTSRWLNQSPPRRRRVIIVACLLAIAFGACLTIWPWLWSAPDAATAPLPEVIGFITADRFADMDSLQRQRFLEVLAKRFVNLNREQRRQFEQLWNDAGLHPSLREQLDQQMGLAVALAAVRHWQRLPPDQRDRYLDQVALARQTLKLPMPFVDHWLSDTKAPAAELLGSEQALDRQLSDMRRQFFAQTTAPERAAMAEVGRELLEREQNARAGTRSD